MNSFQILEEAIGVNRRRNWKATFLNINLYFRFDNCSFYFFPDSGHREWEQLQTGLPWDLIQVPAAPHHTLATSLKPQISILGPADERSGTPVEGAATGLASITIKHNHHNNIRYLIIFQVIDSELTKYSVHFSMSSSKKILLIFHPACWIDLHYWNLNSPDDKWMKSHPKRSSFVAWLLNYINELTLTLTLNARNRNQKECGRE